MLKFLDVVSPSLMEAFIDLAHENEVSLILLFVAELLIVSGAVMKIMMKKKKNEQNAENSDTEKREND